MYSKLGSIETHRRFSLSAEAPVVLLPANGSRTRFLGSVRNLMKKSGSSAVIRAGCGWRLLAEQYSKYLFVPFVLAIVRTLGGIAP